MRLDGNSWFDLAVLGKGCFTELMICVFGKEKMKRSKKKRGDEEIKEEKRGRALE